MNQRTPDFLDQGPLAFLDAKKEKSKILREVTERELIRRQIESQKIKRGDLVDVTFIDNRPLLFKVIFQEIRGNGSICVTDQGIQTIIPATLIHRIDFERRGEEFPSDEERERRINLTREQIRAQGIQEGDVVDFHFYDGRPCFNQVLKRIWKKSGGRSTRIYFEGPNNLGRPTGLGSIREIKLKRKAEGV